MRTYQAGTHAPHLYSAMTRQLTAADSRLQLGSSLYGPGSRRGGRTRRGQEAAGPANGGQTAAAQPVGPQSALLCTAYARLYWRQRLKDAAKGAGRLSITQEALVAAAQR